MEPKPNSAGAALLFVPDISGFTRFVNETEITHSQHIIEELLETLIEANSLGLKISEIEGDAILFYKMAEQPEPEAIAKQARQMFIAFHRHLKLYEHRRICQCGACVAAAGLTLKIVVHHGTISLSKIREREKLFGPDVILVHRLLKNDIPDHEYLLATDSIPLRPFMGYEWMQCKEHSGVYDAGKVNYRYASLSPLRSEIPDPPKPEVKLFRSDHPMKGEKIIDAPLEVVYQKLMDLPTRMKFMDGIRDVRVNDEKHNRINKIGTRHQCVFEKNESDFITSEALLTDGKLQFSETMVKMPVTCVYIAEKLNGKTRLTILYHNQLKFPVSLLFNLFMKKKLARGLENSMQNFKQLCEQK